MKVLLVIGLLAPLLSAPPPPPQAADPPLQHERELFTAKCGQCHDADGRKRLADGSTLLTRLAGSKDWQALLGTRLKAMPPADRQTVTLYVHGLLAAHPSQ
jgi:mono/diheme cytochrome c family protein